LGTATVAITDAPLLALGLNRKLFFLNLLWVVALVASVLVSIVFSSQLMTIAYAVALVAITMAIVMNLLVLRSCRLTLRETFVAMRAAVVPTLAMSVLLVAMKHFIPADGLSWAYTTMLVLVGGCTYLIVASFFFGEIRDVLSRSLARLGDFLRVRHH
jgi:hypothetical protein